MAVRHMQIDLSYLIAVISLILSAIVGIAGI